MRKPSSKRTHQDRINEVAAQLKKMGLQPGQIKDTLYDYSYPQIKRFIETGKLPNHPSTKGMLKLETNGGKYSKAELEFKKKLEQRRNDRWNKRYVGNVGTTHAGHVKTLKQLINHSYDPWIEHRKLYGSTAGKAIGKTKEKAWNSFGGKALFPAIPVTHRLTLQEGKAMGLTPEQIREHNAMLAYNKNYSSQVFSAHSNPNIPMHGRPDLDMEERGRF